MANDLRTPDDRPENANLVEKAESQPQESSKDQQTVKFMLDKYHEAKRSRAPHDSKWVDRYKFTFGEQWKPRRPKYRDSSVLNFTWGTVQTVVSLLVDPRPTINYTPPEPGDIAFAQTFDDVFQSVWEREKFMSVLIDVITDACIYDTGISMESFDPDAYHGLGMLTYDAIDPLFFYPDPNAEDINHKSCNYVMTAEPVNLGELRAQYPEKADKLQSDIGTIGIFPNRQSILSPGNESFFEARNIIDSMVSDAPRKPNQILKITYWGRPDDTEDYMFEDKDEHGNTTKKFERRLKYPNGRKIIMAAGIILEDDEIPFRDERGVMFPFSRFVYGKKPREFWGESLVKTLENPQKLLNKIWSNIMDTMNLMGNPVWVLDETSGVEPDNLFNAPGLIVMKNPGTEVNRLPGTPFQPGLLNAYEMAREIYDSISPEKDVTRGVNPTGVTAAAALETLSDQAQTRIRLVAKNLETYLTSVGLNMFARMAQFFTEPRMFRIQGESDSQDQFFKFHRTKNEFDEEVARIQKISPKQVFDEETGEPIKGQFVPGEVISGPIQDLPFKSLLDVKVSVGPSIAIQKQVKTDRAIRLFESGAIDREALLDVLEMPKKDEILSRIEKKEKAAAEAQAQAQSQGLA